MLLKRTRTMILAGLACSLLAIAPVKATIIQTFDIADITGIVNVSGTIDLAGTGDGVFAINSISFIGTAFGNAVNFGTNSGSATVIGSIITEWTYTAFTSPGPNIGVFAEGFITANTDTVWQCDDFSQGIGCDGGFSASVLISTVFTTSPPAVPEPASLALLATGLAGLGFARRRRSNKTLN